MLPPGGRKAAGESDGADEDAVDTEELLNGRCAGALTSSGAYIFRTPRIRIIHYRSGHGALHGQSCFG